MKNFLVGVLAVCGTLSAFAQTIDGQKFPPKSHSASVIPIPAGTAVAFYPNGRIVVYTPTPVSADQVTHERTRRQFDQIAGNAGWKKSECQIEDRHKERITLCYQKQG